MNAVMYDKKPEKVIEQKRYTYEEWLELDFGDQRAELIDGVIRMMSYGGNKHQAIAGEIFGQLREFLRGKPCRVFYELDTKLEEKMNTVYTPDILVVCDTTKLNKGHGCHGAPDFIVEVLSPSTAKIDKTEKLNAYRMAGVKEYWIIDPDNKLVDALILLGNECTIRTYSEDDRAPVQTLPDCEIDLAAVFSDEVLDFGEENANEKSVT